jgi:hypothetical protein
MEPNRYIEIYITQLEKEPRTLLLSKVNKENRKKRGKKEEEERSNEWRFFSVFQFCE